MGNGCGFYGRRKSVWTDSREWVEMLPREKEKCPKGFPGMKAKSVYKRKNLVAADWLSAQKRRMQA